MKLLVNTCTIGLPFVNEIEQAMAARGVTVVDYPISGRTAASAGRDVVGYGFGRSGFCGAHPADDLAGARR